MNEIQEIKPTNISIGNIKEVFKSSSVTYDESSVTYDSLTDFYGGYGIDEPKYPMLFLATDNKGVFGSSTSTYNETGFAYNEAGQIYGGGDRLDGLVPMMLGVGIIDTTTLRVLAAGQPMGLLLALTYPTAGTIT